MAEAAAGTAAAICPGLMNEVLTAEPSSLFWRLCDSEEPGAAAAEGFATMRTVHVLPTVTTSKRPREQASIRSLAFAPPCDPAFRQAGIIRSSSVQRQLSNKLPPRACRNEAATSAIARSASPAAAPLPVSATVGADAKDASGHSLLTSASALSRAY